MDRVYSDHAKYVLELCAVFGNREMSWEILEPLQVELNLSIELKKEGNWSKWQSFCRCQKFPVIVSS